LSWREITRGCEKEREREREGARQSTRERERHAERVGAREREREREREQERETNITLHILYEWIPRNKHTNTPTCLHTYIYINKRICIHYENMHTQTYAYIMIQVYESIHDIFLVGMQCVGIYGCIKVARTHVHDTLRHMCTTHCDTVRHSTIRVQDKG